MTTPRSVALTTAAGVLVPIIFCWAADAVLAFALFGTSSQHISYLDMFLLLSAFINLFAKPWIIGLICSFFWHNLPAIVAKYPWYCALVMSVSMLPEIIATALCFPVVAFIVMHVICLSGFEFGQHYWSTNPWLVWSGQNAHPYESLHRPNRHS